MPDEANDLTQLRKLAKAATSGEWYVSSFEVSAGGDSRVVMGGDRYSIARIADRNVDENQADAAYIAAANPAVILNLLDEIERLRRKHHDAAKAIMPEFNRAKAAQATLKEAIEALRPFAREADEWGEMIDDTEIPVFTHEFLDGLISREPASYTVGDLRRARAFITKHEGQSDAED